VTAVNSVNPIVVRGLTKRYGRHWALRGIDLDVRRGEVFALLGPNGAGKTTTVEILAGARRATGGDVRVLGCGPGRDRRDWRARIGVVPQSPGAFADLTVREVVAHFAAFYPRPIPVDEVIELVGLSGEARTRTTALSGGQQRRLDVAVGVVGDPDVIFLDEPTTGLDPQARQRAWRLVERFAAQGRTTVLTTHYLDEAQALATRAAIIIDGRVVETGSVADLGGWSAQPTKVRFHRPDALVGRPLPALPAGTHVEDAAARGQVMVHTRQPTAVLHALLRWAAALDVDELPGLTVHRPTLEDVYLALVRERQS
jgi:ABC-2 type transport system ATP-binding protein